MLLYIKDVYAKAPHDQILRNVQYLIQHLTPTNYTTTYLFVMKVGNWLLCIICHSSVLLVLFDTHAHTHI